MEIDYKKEAENLFCEFFKKDWMDEEDWEEFKSELEKETNFSIAKIANELKIGLENGYSIESQKLILKAALPKI